MYLSRSVLQKRVLNVGLTGAGGQIGYSLLPLLARGDVFGKNTQLNLKLIDLPQAQESLRGTMMELEDGSYPLLQSCEFHTDPVQGFKDCDGAIFLGAFPRLKGMERKDLLEKNVGIFKEMGKALEASASRDCKVVVVGNPANTNCMTLARFAPSLSRRNFTALTRLDQSRAQGYLARLTGANVNQVKNVIIWGNHSGTQYPDVRHASIEGVPAMDRLGNFQESEFIQSIQQRGAKIIEARKASSALSAARATAMHMKDWALGNPAMQSMGVLSDGSHYGIPEGICYSFPLRCEGDFSYRIVDNLPIDEFSRKMMDQTLAELIEERDMAQKFL